ncbi:MAG: DNA cytosine methyltransferase [Campylobacterales bacterium]|nr:DNA cytosine methyltransferase [Campylobacterales bacterium]
MTVIMQNQQEYDLKKTSKNFSVVELFAGAGGLALGLECAGFSTKAVLENNKWACETLRKNRPEWNVVEEDVIKIADDGIGKYLNFEGEIDLLSGGYPCQSFSYAGKKLGLEDTRGTLFYSYAEILKELKPKMFLAENVKGLVSHDKGRTLQTMLDVFTEVGYTVSYKVLNSLDYSVAQKRERIVIIGVRNDVKEKIGFDFNFPTPHQNKLLLKDILKDVPNSLCASYPEKKKAIFALVPQGGCWRNLPETVAKEYLAGSYHLGGGKTGIARKMSWDEAGLTVLCSPAQKQTDRCHPDELRPFSVRENARIQSFPDDWDFFGSMAEQYKQIGNAVPVNLACAIGCSIIEYLNGVKGAKNETVQLKFHF